jgi:hypothetical protein
MKMRWFCTSEHVPLRAAAWARPAASVIGVVPFVIAASMRQSTAIGHR